MTPTVADIIGVMEDIAPRRLAEEWDNVGLQLGDPRWPVGRIRIALDPLGTVITAACEAGADLLITHHPLFFKPLKRIDLGTPMGALIETALAHRLAVFAAHTNLDSTAGGINDTLATRLDLCDVEPLDIGRVGGLPATTDLRSLAARMRQTLNLPAVKVAGRTDLPVNRVALCAGSGSSLLSAFFKSGAQVYISADLHYHDARAVEDAGCGLIDVGHFASEHFFVSVLAERIRGTLTAKGLDIVVETCDLEEDPFFSL